MKVPKCLILVNMLTALVANALPTNNTGWEFVTSTTVCSTNAEGATVLLSCNQYGEVDMSINGFTSYDFIANDQGGAEVLTDTIGCVDEITFGKYTFDVRGLFV